MDLNRFSTICKRVVKIEPTCLDEIIKNQKIESVLHDNDPTAHYRIKAAQWLCAKVPRIVRNPPRKPKSEWIMQGAVALKEKIERDHVTLRDVNFKEIRSQGVEGLGYIFGIKNRKLAKLLYVHLDAIERTFSTDEMDYPASSWSAVDTGTNNAALIFGEGKRRGISAQFKVVEMLFNNPALVSTLDERDYTQDGFDMVLKSLFIRHELQTKGGCGVSLFDIGGVRQARILGSLLQVDERSASFMADVAYAFAMRGITTVTAMRDPRNVQVVNDIQKQKQFSYRAVEAMEDFVGKAESIS